MSAKRNIEIARDAVRLALSQGATDAECTVAEGDEFSVTVRMGEVENLKEAGSRGAGLRVLKGKRPGSAYTSDLSAEGVARMVASALELAGITTEDPFVGLPEPEELGSIGGDLELFSEDITRLDTAAKIAAAGEAEAAALGADPRIKNSEGASVESYTGSRVFVNSRGFAGEYKSSTCSLSVVPVAADGGKMERDYWYTVGRGWSKLEPAAEVGRKAAGRALRRLGARKISTRKAPFIFEPRTARSLLEHVFEAVSGDLVYRKATFLAEKLGQRIGSEQLTVIDDGTIPGLFGTSPFDDEGVPSRRTVVVERGVLRSFLLNTYTARKLGFKTTGSASRGLTGNAGVGHGNLFIEPGTAAPEEIFRAAGSALYVTELIGFGVNIVTGDYSRGASGLWIENGEVQYPVSEVTIAGNLGDMMSGIELAGSDLEFRGSTASPTLLIREMTISGE